MATPRPRLLCYGHDRVLQLTRRWVLERAFSVQLCERVWEFAGTMRNGPLDALILCHTVPDAECRQVILLAQESSPWAKTLMLHPLTGRRRGLRGDANMVGLEGPVALLQAVQTLLEETGKPAVASRAAMDAAVSSPASSFSRLGHAALHSR